MGAHWRLQSLSVDALHPTGCRSALILLALLESHPSSMRVLQGKADQFCRFTKSWCLCRKDDVYSRPQAARLISVSIFCSVQGVVSQLSRHAMACSVAHQRKLWWSTTRLRSTWTNLASVSEVMNQAEVSLKLSMCPACGSS